MNFVHLCGPMSPFPFWNIAAPAIPKKCNGLSATHKSNTLQKRGQRFSLRARSWGRETESVGWPKEGLRDRGGTNKGRVFPAWEPRPDLWERMTFYTRTDFGGPVTLEVLESWGRVGQMAPLLCATGTADDSSLCAPSSSNWTFIESSRSFSPTHQQNQPSIHPPSASEQGNKTWETVLCELQHVIGTSKVCLVSAKLLAVRNYFKAMFNIILKSEVQCCSIFQYLFSSHIMLSPILAPVLLHTVHNFGYIWLQIFCWMPFIRAE